MKIKHAPVYWLIVVAVLVSCGTASSKEFRSQEGKFSVMAPLSLEEGDQTVSTQIGQIVAHLFVGEATDIAYVVSYADYPEEFVTQSNSDLMLDGASNGAVSNVNGKLVIQNVISLQNYPGREIVADVKSPDGTDGTMKGRLYLVGNRLYQVIVIATKGKVEVTKIDSFLNSFKLLTGE